MPARRAKESDVMNQPPAAPSAPLAQRRAQQGVPWKAQRAIQPGARRRPLPVLAGFATLLLAALGALAGCGTAGSAAGSSATPSSGASHTVVDSAGRTVVIPAHLSRIADIGATPVLSSMIFLFHAENMLVNANAQALSSLQPFQAIFDPGINQLPTIQDGPSQVNAEQVAALNPQLVITDEEPLIPTLTQAGLTVLYVTWREPASLEKAVTMMGQVFGEPTQATRYNAFLTSTIAGIKSDLKGVSSSSYPRVLSGDPSPLGEPSGSQIHWWGSLVGLDNVDQAGDSGASTSFSIEQVLAWNPQWIFTQTPSDVPGFENDSRYANVTAVENRQVEALPGGFLSWGNTTTESPLLLLWLAKKLHPAQTASINIDSAITSFYQTFYGKTLTAAQVQSVLTDGTNRGS
jgi:iron complex transport system substrate-binding protein